MERKVKTDLRKSLICFGGDFVQLYKRLVFNQKEFVISKRILKSGICIGACYSAGEKDRAYRKAVETEFWIELLGSYRESRIDKELICLKGQIKNLICELEKVI